MFMTLTLLTLMYYLKVKFKTVIWKPVSYYPSCMAH